jgi:hypothetical protein
MAMRIWAGRQRKGAVINGTWQGAEPLWNIGIHLRSEEVQQGLKISEVEKTIIDALKSNFPSYSMVISPRAKTALTGQLDGI